MRRTFCYVGWIVFAAFCTIVVMFGIDAAHHLGERYREMANRSPAFSYGQDGATYFKLNRDDLKPAGPLTVPATGADIWICWDEIVWFRPIPMKLKVWFLDVDGRRVDYDDSLTVHDIYPPPKMGPFPPKCRAWKLPPGLSPGSHVMAGVARPSDLESKSEPVLFPRIGLVVKAP